MTSKVKREVKITYRGWPGHYCEGHKCVFHLNTLLECKTRRYVVSTVGNILRDRLDTRSELNYQALDFNTRYYETMIFGVKRDGVYWDARADRQVYTDDDLPWCVETLDHESDVRAQEVHEANVAWVKGKLERGEKLR